jgi:hypothetical protein
MRSSYKERKFIRTLDGSYKVCSLGQITSALFEVGGQYRRNKLRAIFFEKGCVNRLSRFRRDLMNLKNLSAMKGFFMFVQNIGFAYFIIFKLEITNM